MNLWHIFLFQPLVNILLFMYQALGENLGIAIIATTILVRLLLIPLTSPGMKSAAKMQELRPELEKLKVKHGKDKQALAQAQLELYKKNNINPFGSLLPTILQFILLIAMFQAFTSALKPGQAIGEINSMLYSFIRLPENTTINTQFLYLDVTKPDVFALPTPLVLGPLVISVVPGIFLIGSALVQYLSTKLMLKAGAKQQVKKSTGENSGPEDMMVTMQKQMMVIGPIMTLVIGFNFPSGMVLYWFVISLTMVVQQLYMQRQNKAELEQK